jgi:hypothetical protein
MTMGWPSTAPPPKASPEGAALGGRSEPAELRLAQLRPVPHFLGRRLSDDLPGSLGRTSGPFYPYPESPWTGGRDPAVGRRDLVARLQEALHRPFFTPYPFGLFAY